MTCNHIHHSRCICGQETHFNGINDTPKDQLEKMAGCDDRMLYYKGRCELDSSKFFCSNSAVEGYLILRGRTTTEDIAFPSKGTIFPH